MSIVSIKISQPLLNHNFCYCGRHYSFTCSSPDQIWSFTYTTLSVTFMTPFTYKIWSRHLAKVFQQLTLLYLSSQIEGTCSLNCIALSCPHVNTSPSLYEGLHFCPPHDPSLETRVKCHTPPLLQEDFIIPPSCCHITRYPWAVFVWLLHACLS